MTPPLEFSEPRRSFVKKTLATTVSISFAGLIRAHGEGSTGDTSNPDETTIATTDSGGTTTWNPDQTTYATTIGESTTWDPDETTLIIDRPSLAKFQPEPAEPWIPQMFTYDEDGNAIGPAIVGKYWKRSTEKLSRVGSITAKDKNGNILYNFTVIWMARVHEIGSTQPDLATYFRDCVTYECFSDLQLSLSAPQGNSNAEQVMHDNIRLAVISEILGIQVVAGNPDFNGPRVLTGTSVIADRDWCENPETYLTDYLPVVRLSRDYGFRQDSTIGYWLDVERIVTPTPPNQRVKFKWMARLRKSSRCDLVKLCKNAVISSLNVATDFYRNVASLVVDIPPLPEIDNRINPFVQPVTAFDFPPDFEGFHCSEYGSPSALPGDLDPDHGLNKTLWETIDNEEPYNENWDKEDPEEIPFAPWEEP